MVANVAELVIDCLEPFINLALPGSCLSQLLARVEHYENDVYPTWSRQCQTKGSNGPKAQ